MGGYYIVGGSTLRITATSCKYTQLHISVYSIERKNVRIQTDFKSVCMCTFMCTNSDRKTETKTKYPACARFPNLEKTKRCTKSIVLRLFTHPPSHLFQPQTAANLCSSTPPTSVDHQTSKFTTQNLANCHQFRLQATLNLFSLFLPSLQTRSRSQE